MGALYCPKVLTDSRYFPNFSEGLLRDCEQRPGKSTYFLLYVLSHYVENDDGVFPFSLAVFLFSTTFLIFYEEER